MKHSFYILLSILLLSFTSCSNSETKTIEVSEADKALLEKGNTYFSALPLIAKNLENTKSKQKIDLGHKLFFDNQLSKDQTQSCNTCHNLKTYGVDNEATSVGDDGGRGDRNSPTVLNSALHTTQFWDGRSKDVEEQAGLPILNPVEMAIPSEEFLVDRLKQDSEYPGLFKNAFPDQEDPLTYENIRLTIALFERELLTPSPFDAFLKGDPTALNDKQKEGLNAFIDVGCITCHTGPLLGGNMFQKFGVYGNYWEHTNSTVIDDGRFKETQNEADKYMFKVPSMRNISETHPYFHDGSVSSLKDAIQIMAEVQLNKKLSAEQVDSIDEFLKSLSAPDGGVKKEYQSAPI